MPELHSALISGHTRFWPCIYVEPFTPPGVVKGTLDWHLLNFFSGPFEVKG